MAIVEADIDALTESWIRNESDRLAALNGCRMDLERGLFTVWWIERHCRLYQGESAGQRLMLHSCNDCRFEDDFEVPDEWDEEAFELYALRAMQHNRCIEAWHHMDWQFDCTTRCFGWVKHSTHWQREVRRFRKASIWVPKKNKKSPTMAAWGLYLECGDGEPGQNVYFAAKDGTQAREIGVKHVIEMVRHSPELEQECTINLTKCSVVHEPTRSTLMPLSSSNVSTIQSKEGLNGSSLVDETHVVDRAFIQTIDRAGISRSEPLHAEFSTAGDDPDSYGKEQYDLAEKIISGEIVDERTFAAIYAAPQDLKDTDLAKDPMKYGRMANPAMGHTIDPEEYLSDYETSRNNPRKLVIFKKYRLNIWQNAANPWLKRDWWIAGKREFTKEDLRGRKCWASLDLSAVRDFTSLCLGFPMEKEQIFHLWYYWLPQATADEIRDRIPIDKWEHHPLANLILIPGECIDYGFVRSSFREIVAEFNVQGLAYDDWNAEKVTQEIAEGVRDHTGQMVERGLGIKRMSFSQSLKNMNEPSKTFEIRMSNGLVNHNGDPLTEWMMSNATIRPDQNGNYKPLKPARGSLKKIDGVVTGIMVDAVILNGGNAAGSVYEQRGILAL